MAVAKTITASYISAKLRLIESIEMTYAEDRLKCCA